MEGLFVKFQMQEASGIVAHHLENFRLDGDDKQGGSTIPPRR